MKKQLDRRSFLKTTVISATTLSVFPALAAENRKAVAAESSASVSVVGANGDIRCAVVGFHGRGQSHMQDLRGLKGVRLVALCDVDSKVLERGVASCESAGQKVQGYTDVRKLLENKDIDVVTFATPNHWHALGSIWAIQAGKDVYVEKPVSHNVWEGHQVIAAARQHGRIVQAGTQARSSAAIREGIAWLHEGNLGKIIRARGLCYKRRASIGKVSAPQPIPPNIDYDLWCGPAPKEPLMRHRLHYDWHWVWPTGNGDLGNQGIHEMDVARWVLGEPALSSKVLSIGGRLGYVDDGTTPNTLIIYHHYERAPLVYEVRGLPDKSGSAMMDNYQGASVGIVTDCEGGSMIIPNYNSATV